MTMAPPSNNGGSDRDIHRLFDGDLSPAEIEALIEAEKKRDPRGISGTRVKLEALGDLRAVIRAATSDESDPIDADAAWAQIAARIEGASSTESEGRVSAPKISAPSRPALRVIEGGLSEKAPREDTGSSERAAERAESAPPGLLQRVDRAAADRDEESQRRERQVRQRRSIIMVVSGLAAAAAAAIAFLGPSDTGTNGGVDPTTQPPSTVAVTTPVYDPVVEEQLRRTEVIAVDFGTNVGTVFSVEGTEGSRYAVVWLADEADKAADTDDTNAPEPSGSSGPESDDTANL
jgi:hypothetical protein